jgi:antitoxin HicB
MGGLGLNIGADARMAKNMEKNLQYYERLPYNVIVEQWDDGEGPYWVARVAELPHCLIHGDTPEEAVREIEEVKRDWIKSNLERGLKIPEPVPHKYSGQISLRIPPSLHRLLSDKAAVEEISLNQLMATALARSVGFQIETTKTKAKVRGKP